MMRWSQQTIFTVRVMMGWSQQTIITVRVMMRRRQRTIITVRVMMRWRCQTPRFHYGSKVPAVTITVFIAILEQNR